MAPRRRPISRRNKLFTNADTFMQRTRAHHARGLKQFKRL